MDSLLPLGWKIKPIVPIVRAFFSNILGKIIKFLSLFFPPKLFGNYRPTNYIHFFMLQNVQQIKFAVLS